MHAQLSQRLRGRSSGSRRRLASAPVRVQHSIDVSSRAPHEAWHAGEERKKDLPVVAIASLMHNEVHEGPATRADSDSLTPRFTQIQPHACPAPLVFRPAFTPLFKMGFTPAGAQLCFPDHA
eukprot:1985530-Pyramimonas_sp.AAC.1